MSADLNWRIERACAAAFPPMRCGTVGGWNVSLSGGPRRRINSASPQGPDTVTDAATVARIAATFDAVGQVARIRVTDLVDVGTTLDEAGFAPPIKSTRTLGRVLEGSFLPGNVVGLTMGPDHEWLSTRSALSLALDGAPEDYGPMLARLTIPAAFARIGDRAVAYAVVMEGVLALEAVATHPRWRRRGHARDCLMALLHWGAGAGATHAALQVMADNHRAIALYRNLGFLCDHYSYHYRERVR